MHLVGFTDLNISANTHVLIPFDQNIWSFLDALYLVTVYLHTLYVLQQYTRSAF